MKTNLVLVVIATLGLGFGAGYIVGESSSDNTTELAVVDSHSDQDSHSNKSTSHTHGEGEALFSVAAEDAPSVQISVNEDAKSGWNVRLDTTNFNFTPGSINGDNVVGQGHAHLYVDGEKIGRLYGPDFHYDENFDGTREFRVTLNANDHSEFAVDGNVVEAITQITHVSHN